MKIFEAIKNAKERIKDSQSPQLDAEVLLSYCLNMDKTHIYMNRSMEMERCDAERYFGLIERRKNGEPVQYITGRREFMSLDFFVRPGVLIPRPDTECLVEEVLERIKNIDNPVVADIGCGSGAIGVSIAKYAGNSTVYALDISDIPVEITSINAQNNGVSDKVHAIKSNLLRALGEEFYGRFDVVVSNPPYIKEDEINSLMVDVKYYEPHIALSGGSDGLDFYRRISRDAFKYLKYGGIIAYEIGYDEKNSVFDILKNEGYSNMTCKKDLAGLDRAVIGYKMY